MSRFKFDTKQVTPQLKEKYLGCQCAQTFPPLRGIVRNTWRWCDVCPYRKLELEILGESEQFIIRNKFCYGMYSQRRFLTWLRASRLFAQELVDERRLPRGMISNDQDLKWYEISKFCCFGWYAHVWYDHAPTSADSMLSWFSLVATTLQRWIPDYWLYIYMNSSI